MRTLALLLIVLAGCVKVPPPDAGMRREAARSGNESCRGRTCRSSVSIGGTRLAVVTDSTIAREQDLPGREQSNVRRAAGAIAGAILRANDGSTFQHLVGTGRITVDDEAASWNLECDVAWVDEEERSRERDGTDARELTRIADGMDCSASQGDPNARTWRFRRGIPTALDSISARLDALEEENEQRPWRNRAIPMSLTSDGGISYTIEEEVTGMGAMRVWRVLRDRTGVAVVHVPLAGDVVLDIGDSATDREIAAMRLVVAAVARNPGRK